MKYDPRNPQWDDRDRLIISKGHCSPIAYVTLAHFGFFPQEELKTFRKTLNEEGAVEGSIEMAASAITGSYSLEVYTSNDILLASKDFMIEEHTFKYLKSKEYMEYDVSNRDIYENWIKKGKPSITDNARELAEKIIAGHKVKELSPESVEIFEIQRGGVLTQDG